MSYAAQCGAAGRKEKTRGGDNGDQLDQIVKTEMSPEELMVEEKIQGAMKLLGDDSMLKFAMENKEDILDGLMAGSNVDFFEIARMRADDEYFQKTMLENYARMSKRLRDEPELLKMTQETAEHLEVLKRNGRNPKGGDN
jgi:hypothetical protein